MTAPRGLLLALGLAASALPAGAQEGASGWHEYVYEADHFHIQFPAAPTVSAGPYRLGGRSVTSSRTYAVREPGAVMSVTVADYGGDEETNRSLIEDALKAAAGDGDVRLNTEAHVDHELGRQISVADKDGGRTMASAFYSEHRLYLIVGRALPPDPEDRGDRIIRFVETLSLPDRDAPVDTD